MAAQEGAMVKRFHCGRAAQSGVYSALLAQRGFTGITDVLEAPLRRLSHHAIPTSPTRRGSPTGSATTWETLQGRLQAARERDQHPHRARRAREIMREHKLAADDIERVDVGLSAR